MGKPYFEIGRYGSVGLELVLTILIPAAVGHWLDGRYWHNGGYGAGAGFLIGCAVGFRNLVRTANGMQRDIERAEAMDPEANKWTVDEAWMHREGQDVKKADPTVEPDEHGKNGPTN